jgi:hypothetical protein
MGNLVKRQLTKPKHIRYRYSLSIQRIYTCVLCGVFQFHLDKKDPVFGDYVWLNEKAYMYVGVTIEPPQTLCLPGDACEWGYAVVINNNHITLRGQYLVSH